MIGRPELYDQRTRAARRFKQLVSDFIADLGGNENLTIAEKALIRQAAVVMMRAEEMQASILNGDTVDDATLVRLSNAAARILGQLGVQHRKRQPVHVPAWRQSE
jgi:hypothetical protein